MKARYSTNKRLESVAETMYQQAMSCISANFILMLAVLHKYFNFGTNAEHTGRLDKFLELWEQEAQKTVEYGEEIDQSFTDEYIKKMWNGLRSDQQMKTVVFELTKGYVPEEYRMRFLHENQSIKETERTFKRRAEEREKITMCEASEVQAKMLAFRDAMKASGG